MRLRPLGKTGSARVGGLGGASGGRTVGIRVEIGIDCADPVQLAPFWARALGYRVGHLDDDGTYLDLRPEKRAQPVIYFQRVPEAKQVKNRLHLDLWTHHPQREITRLVALGASQVGDPLEDARGSWWQVMSDPEGNEFCVCRECR